MGKSSIFKRGGKEEAVIGRKIIDRPIPESAHCHAAIRCRAPSQKRHSWLVTTRYQFRCVHSNASPHGRRDSLDSLATCIVLNVFPIRSANQKLFFFKWPPHCKIYIYMYVYRKRVLHSIVSEIIFVPEIRFEIANRLFLFQT